MKTQIIDFDQSSLSPKGSVLSLGGFDGIHLGHQALIERLLAEAKKRKAPSCLCLFDPLPFQFLSGKRPFKRLFTIEETQEFLEPFGIDFFCIIPFTRSFSKLRPEEFIQSFIVRHFDPLLLVVGYDFSFAHQREGNFSVLQKLALRWGFSTKRIEPCLLKKQPISSSRIRQCLSLAQMNELKVLLGRPFSIKGIVERGAGRGRKIGFPTANLKLNQKELPPMGVYGGRAQIAGSWYKSAINIGQCPTFASKKGGGAVVVEVHLIPSPLFSLYNRPIRVELDFFIRPERAFPNTEELKTAIKEDIQRLFL